MQFSTNNLNVVYQPTFLPREKSDSLFQELEKVNFYTPTFTIGGKKCQPNRKIFAYGDAGVTYAFSGTKVPAEPWSTSLQQLREAVEQASGSRYNYALLNYYPDGTSKICAHKDNETDLDRDSPIACVSLGATRTIVFQKPNSEPVSIELLHGSLYLMFAPTNELFTHEIPAQPDVKEPRISITFRKIETSAQPPAKKARISPRAELMQTFDLDYNAELNIILDMQKGVRIHIREITSEIDMWKPRGIVLTPATWLDFIDKMMNFNLQYSKASFIANNQLAVFSTDQQCVLQQIFQKGVGFSMKPACMILHYDHIQKLCEQRFEIRECLEKVILCHALPQMIASKTCQKTQHLNQDQAFKVVCQYVFQNMNKQFSKVYFCEGCSVNHPSQFRHECMMSSASLKYFTAGDRALLHINIMEITEKLCQEQCVCAFKEDFYKKLSVDDYKNEFKFISEDPKL